MKIYASFSDSHLGMLTEFFLPSIPIGFDLHLRKIKQIGSGVYMSSGWADSTREKAKYWVDAANSNHNEIFLCSDVDVVFLPGASTRIFIELLGDCDIAFQDNTDGLCSGFFVARGTKRVLNFFLQIVHLIGSADASGNTVSDQEAARMLKSLVRYKIISRNLVFTIGNDKASLPEGALVYHANWIVGADNKHSALKEAIDTRL